MKNDEFVLQSSGLTAFTELAEVLWKAAQKLTTLFYKRTRLRHPPTGGDRFFVSKDMN